MSKLDKLENFYYEKYIESCIAEDEKIINMLDSMLEQDLKLAEQERWHEVLKSTSATTCGTLIVPKLNSVFQQNDFTPIVTQNNSTLSTGLTLLAAALLVPIFLLCIKYFN